MKKLIVTSLFAILGATAYACTAGCDRPKYPPVKPAENVSSSCECSPCDC